MQQRNPMEGLIDKLCDHLPTHHIKTFIENGFDEWDTVTLMNGQQLVELGYSPQQCIAIMVAINSQGREVEGRDIFDESSMGRVLAASKQQQIAFKERVEKEQLEAAAAEKEVEEKMNQAAIEEGDQEFDSQEYPDKPITEALLSKGVTLKGKQKPPLNKVTLISLEERQITRIGEMEKVPHIANLHLGHNRLTQIQNLHPLHKLKILKLQSNNISKIRDLQPLGTLEQLLLNDNRISRLEGLTHNNRLHLLNLNNQRSKRSLSFCPQSCQALSYCLEVLHCDGNRVKDISNLGVLKVANKISLRNSALGDMGVLSEPLAGMERLRTLDFRGSPLTALPKYRDYVVILSKTLEQLDTKKILPTEREYLVKLYSLKHAKQQREEQMGRNKQIGVNQEDLQVTKLREGSGKYIHGGDLRGNAPYANTKVQKR